MHPLKEALTLFIEENQSNLLVFVDELDRCRPDYAISYLETIKHVFDVKGIVFILAVDRAQLECSAKAAFGAELDFPEYFRKFIHREVNFPQPTIDSYKSLSSKYVSYYLERENERFCFLKLEDRTDNIVKLISALKLTPRQIQEVFRILGHCVSTTEEKKGTLRWCLGVGTILMSALKLGNPVVYQSLGKQELTIIKAMQFIKEIEPDYGEWWFTLIYTGGGLSGIDTTDKDIAQIYFEAGLTEKNNIPDVASHISQWHSGWGLSHNSRFRQIFNLIEEISSWS